MSSKRTALSALAFLIASALFAQSVPPTINYQGRLTDNTPAQTPVNATVPMSFAIYSTASGGAPLWLEPVSGGTSVPVVNGIFNVSLGANGVAIPPATFTGANSTRYLEITMNPGTPGAEILAPRQLIAATGYANLAQNANNAVSAATATTAGSATSAATATTAGSFTGPLAGDVTGTQSATAVANSATAGTDIVAAIGNAGAAGTIPAARLPAMAGATASTAGATGLAPAPPAGRQTSFLRGDGIWSMANGVCVMQDIQPSGTNGGTCTSGAWQARTMNSLKGNATCAAGGSPFGVAAGTYLIHASAPGNRVGAHQIRLFDITNNVVVAYGSTEVTSTAAPSQSRSELLAYINPLVTTNYRIEQQCAVTRAADGFGIAAGFAGASEVYTQVEIVLLVCGNC